MLYNFTVKLQQKSSSKYIRIIFNGYFAVLILWNPHEINYLNLTTVIIYGEFMKAFLVRLTLSWAILAKKWRVCELYDFKISFHSAVKGLLTKTNLLFYFNNLFFYLISNFCRVNGVKLYYGVLSPAVLPMVPTPALNYC